ncbi:unnamed protein product [Arabidopsis halleri]
MDIPPQSQSHQVHYHIASFFFFFFFFFFLSLNIKSLLAVRSRNSVKSQCLPLKNTSYQT